MGYGRGLHGLRCPGSWRQGRGNKFPLPVGPTPRGDIHTVHSMGRPWRRAGYGCSPDIATHGPRSRWGRGRSAAGAGGVGAAGEVSGYPPAKARAGWGLPAEAYGYPSAKARVGRGLPTEVHG